MEYKNNIQNLFASFSAIPEEEMPAEILDSGVYINRKKDRWEIWFVDDTVEDTKPKLLGFCDFSVGDYYKDIWKKEFFQSWAGIPLEKNGWDC